MFSFGMIIRLCLPSSCLELDKEENFIGMSFAFYISVTGCPTTEYVDVFSKINYYNLMS